MVLCLKTRESRSLPGLPRTTASLHLFDNHTAVSLHKSTAVCVCLASSPLKPASKATAGGLARPNSHARLGVWRGQTRTHGLGFGAAKLARVDAGWSSPVARQAHNLKVTGSNPVPATNHTQSPPAPPARRALACPEADGSSLLSKSHARSSRLP